jgi:hypothetical protein
MYYQMGNFIHARGAAWALLSERVATMAARCADASSGDTVPAAVPPSAAPSLPGR